MLCCHYQTVLRSNPHQQESPKSASMDVVTIFISFQQNHLLKLSILSYRNLAKISFLSMDKKLIFIQIIQGDCLACTNAVFGGGTWAYHVYKYIYHVDLGSWDEMNCDDRHDTIVLLLWNIQIDLLPMLLTLSFSSLRLWLVHPNRCLRLILNIYQKQIF